MEKDKQGIPSLASAFIHLLPRKYWPKLLLDSTGLGLGDTDTHKPYEPPNWLRGCWGEAQIIQKDL